MSQPSSTHLTTTQTLGETCAVLAVRRRPRERARRRPLPRLLCPAQLIINSVSLLFSLRTTCSLYVCGWTSSAERMSSGRSEQRVQREAHPAGGHSCRPTSKRRYTTCGGAAVIVRVCLNFIRPCWNGWNGTRLFVVVRSIPSCLCPY